MGWIKYFIRCILGFLKLEDNAHCSYSYSEYLLWVVMNILGQSTVLGGVCVPCFPKSLRFSVPVLQDFREKNMDYMRPDIVALLRSSDSAYVRELIGMDPVAVFRWAVLRAAVQAMAVFAEAGRQRAQKTAGMIWKSFLEMLSNTLKLIMLLGRTSYCKAFQMQSWFSTGDKTNLWKWLNLYTPRRLLLFIWEHSNFPSNYGIVASSLGQVWNPIIKGWEDITSSRMHGFLITVFDLQWSSQISVKFQMSIQDETLKTNFEQLFWAAAVYLVVVGNLRNNVV